ncbi:MAG TPA: hypothetical protein VEY71_07225, partial [Chitinophagales bacterium]|nr:hypothetical protein [Chitinophagales bacterium]
MTRFIFPASFLVLLLAFASQAQHLREPIRIDGVQPGKAVCSDVQHLPPAGERFHDAADNWNFYLRSMEKRKVGFEYVQELKNTYGDKRMMEVPSLKTEETNVITPVIGQQFDTNNFDGSYPPDNTIAVSNNGWIVSVTNSSVRYYDAAGAFKGSKSFETFADDDALTSILYDPKILYDSGSDRFFLTFLHGYTSATSDVLVFFSKT